MDDEQTPPEHSDEEDLGARAPTPGTATDRTGSRFDDDLVWQPAPRPRWSLTNKIVFVALLVAAGALLFVRLSQPSRLLTDGFKPPDGQCVKWPTYHTNKCWELTPLDEVHYVPDSRDVLRFGTESDTRVPTPDDGAFVVHPPAGKWFIALGIWLFGDRPFGWRFFGAAFGLLGVLSMYMLALRLFRSHWWAAMAAALLALDGLWFVQSRVAMLDIYAASALLAGVWMTVEDRDRASPERGTRRWWRLGAGACFGFAVASKYPLETLLFVFIVMVASARWEAMKAPFARRQRSLTSSLAGVLGTFVVLPALLYVASYTPWFIDGHRYNPPRCVAVQAPAALRSVGLRGVGTVFEKWGCYQYEILDFHRHLAKYEAVTATPSPSGAPTVVPGQSKPAHPYFSNAWSWPWIGRPVAHYFSVSGTGAATRDAEVVGIPNPVIWWTGFFIALPLLLWWTIRKRDNLSPLLLALFLGGWVPYIAADAINRPVFMFYATPLVPFIVLSVVHMWHRATWRAPELWVLPAIYLLLAGAAFAYFYPVLGGFPVPPDGLFGWHGRMWLSHDCGSQYDNKIKIFCWI